MTRKSRGIYSADTGVDIGTHESESFASRIAPMLNGLMGTRLIAVVAAASIVSGYIPSVRAVTIDMVTVGNSGNTADPATGSLYGAVGYEYRIGRYEVTIGQYCDFLNAVARADTYGLYSTNMSSNLNIAGISRTGVSGSYSYSVTGPSGTAPAGASSALNRPITYVSWWDAARFTNWVANGQPTGAQNSTTTENGTYPLNGATSGASPAKNATNPNTNLAPAFWIPTEDEWYKAAFFSPLLNSGTGGYYTYATRSDVMPGNSIGNGSNQANHSMTGAFSVTQSATYVSTQNYLTNVGAFSASASFYGTFDQSGNVEEWNDLTGASGFSRGTRGGGWAGGDLGYPLSSGYRGGGTQSYQSDGLGFRLAAPVPEPSTYAMALAGLACGGFSMWRRRKRA